MDWFTADTHAYHEKIIIPCNRPFTSGEQMTIALAETLNKYVAPTDILFHLGDFCWKGSKWWAEFRGMINCRQVFLIRGNHDKIGLNDTHKWFAGIFDFYERDDIIMCHFPLETWNRMAHGTYHFHGHCHGLLGEPLLKLRADVGVDAQGYRPISRDEVEVMMRAKMRTRDALLPYWEARGHHSFGRSAQVSYEKSPFKRACKKTQEKARRHIMSLTIILVVVLLLTIIVGWYEQTRMLHKYKLISSELSVSEGHLTRRKIEIQEARDILLAELPDGDSPRPTHTGLVALLKHYLRTSSPYTSEEQEQAENYTRAVTERDAALKQCEELKQKLDEIETAEVVRRNKIMEALGLRRGSLRKPIGDGEAGSGQEILDSIRDVMEISRDKEEADATAQSDRDWVDVCVPPKELPEYMQAIARMFKRQRSYNPTTGTFDERYSPMVQEDDYLP